MREGWGGCKGETVPCSTLTKMAECHRERAWTVVSFKTGLPHASHTCSDSDSLAQTFSLASSFLSFL